MVTLSKKTKTLKTLERHFKGVANHRRIQILLYVARHPDTTVYILTEQLKCNFRTTSSHTQRLVTSGLLEKRYHGREVLHSLTPYGERFLKFIAEFGNLRL